MVYENVWKVLEEIIIELRKKGLKASPAVMKDLKSAKTLMKVLDASERDRGETELRIRQYLGSIEVYLITEAQKTFPPSRIDTWLRRIEEANCQTCQTCSKNNETTKKVEKFITGVPRNQKWVRVEPLVNLPVEKLKQLAGEIRLSFREEKNGQLVLYGNSENIKKLIKKISEQTAFELKSVNTHEKKTKA